MGRARSQRVVLTALAGVALIGLVAMSGAGPVLAATFYVDPVTGSAGGDGSAGDPWRTIEEVVDAGLIETRAWAELPYEEGAQLEVVNPGAPVRAGDTIRLRSGYHGVLFIESAYNEERITIEADEGQTPSVARLHLRSVSEWTIRGLSVSSEYAPVPEAGDLVFIESHNWRGPSSDVTIEGCELFSTADASDWSRQDWDELSANGIRVDGDRVIIRDNVLRNVDFGITVSGEYAVVTGNVIDGFAGDGLRGLGDHALFEGNVVMNCYDVNENHDDGFQSWSVGEGGVGTGEVVDVVLRGNTIINYTDSEQPFRCTLQGIGCFDGMFVDWVIENNVIQTDHWHGITLSGSVDSRIVNNTVIDLNDERPGPPWIRVGDHKDGRPSRDTIVRNNLTTSLSIDRLGDGETATSDGVRVDSNLVFDAASAGALFVDVAGGDLHLADNSAAIDQGVSELAPEVDHDGIPRPQGAAVDIGAYEWFEGTPELPDRAPDAGAESPGCACRQPLGRSTGLWVALFMAVALGRRLGLRRIPSLRLRARCRDETTQPRGRRPDGGER